MKSVQAVLTNPCLEEEEEEEEEDDDTNYNCVISGQSSLCSLKWEASQFGPHP
jgi:hypothetical protein